MLDFLPYVIRSALRNKVRTVLTLLGVAVAVGVFSLLASLESSMNRTIDVTAQSSLLVVQEKDQWWPMQSHLPDQLGLEKTIEAIPRVKRAMAIYIKTNAWGQSGGLVKIEGIDKEKFEEFIPIEVDPEVLKRFRETPDGALLGRDFLKKYEKEYPWKVGQSYKLKQLKGVSITFVGSFESDNEVYNTIILSDRRYLQEVDSRLGEASQVFVRIEDPSDAALVSAAIDSKVPELFPYKTKTKDQRAFMSDVVQDMREMVKLSHVVMAITLLVVLVSVANTISMATRDRTQEFGIVRSLGFRRSHILGLVLGESLMLSLVGGALGLGAAVLVMNWKDLYLGVTGVNLKISITPEVIVMALLTSLAVGVIGGLVPAWGASRLKIVESLRNVD